METPVVKDIFDQFIQKLGSPTTEDDLKAYVNFVLDHTIVLSEAYTENHHILPVSVFPELSAIKEYQAVLAYEDHIEAHRLLATAYPIRKFTAPLNFMLRDKSKAYELDCIAKSKGMKDFMKSDMGVVHRRLQSERMSVLMKDGLASELNNKRFRDPIERQKVGEQFANLWQDEAYREKTINTMKTVHNTPERKQQLADAMTKRWSDPKLLEEHTIYMTEINRSEAKRIDAGEKIKAKWQEIEFKEKMTNRKRRGAYTVPHFWWNDGTNNSMSPTCPIGYVKGRIKRKKI